MVRLVRGCSKRETAWLRFRMKRHLKDDGERNSSSIISNSYNGVYLVRTVPGITAGGVASGYFVQCRGVREGRGKGGLPGVTCLHGCLSLDHAVGTK